MTQQVADVSSLVSSQQAAISALRGLLRHAANVGQLLQVQQQISADESSLESLQAQQRALDHETYLRHGQHDAARAPPTG